MTCSLTDTAIRSVVDAARERASTGFAIIAFANFHYREVLLNWLVALAAAGIENYLVVALDDALYAWLDAHHIPAVLSPVSGDLGALWRRRVEVFSALCAAGIDFVHSDADAVWLRDPLNASLHDPSADLVISQGTVWPPDVHRQFGFVLCCGLFRLRSTARTRRLMSELQAHVATTGDDQVSLNRLILNRSPQWRFNPGDAYYVEGKGARFLCSRSLVRGVGSDGLSICLLPQHLFQRVPLTTSDVPYVLHLLTPKDPAAKLREFARYGCLVLRPDWRRIEFDASSLARLTRIPDAVA